jgi:hypothetical protein
LLPVLVTLGTVIQLALLAAVHLAVETVAVTAIVPADATAEKLADAGLSEKTGVPGAAADCVIVTVTPATVRVPDRVLDVFGVTA